MSRYIIKDEDMKAIAESLFDNGYIEGCETYAGYIGYNLVEISKKIQSNMVNINLAFCSSNSIYQDVLDWKKEYEEKAGNKLHIEISLYSLKKIELYFSTNKD